MSTTILRLMPYGHSPLHLKGRARLRGMSALIVGLALATGCTAGSQGRDSADSGATATAQTQGPRGTVRIAWPTEPENLHPKLAAGSGLNEYFWVFNSFLTYYDFAGAPHPMIARDIPSRENGGWIVNPDGTMVTTYLLRPNARWHDGTTLSASDFVLGYRVVVDPEMPIRDRVPETLMSRVEAPDPHTVVVYWAAPYVAANLLTFQQLSPLPVHLVEETYRTNKSSLVYGEDWTSGYVGTGPFRIDRWNPGSSLVARANTDWFLGPPRVAALEIRFISDSATMLANLLAGDVDMINSPGVRMPEAAVARDQWVSRGEGYLKIWQRQLRFHGFQFREVPRWQRAIADVRVRRALMNGTDRKELAESLTYGLGMEAHAFINPADRLFPEVDRVVQKYPYDPRAALGLLSEAGWTPPQPGSPLIGPGGQTLDVELWITLDGGGQQEALIVEDNWKRLGINASLFLIPTARQRDNELRVSFPAVAPTARSITLDNFVFVGTHLPTLETRWQGANRGSFQDAEVDRLHNLGLTSLDQGEREAAIVALHRRMSEVLGIGPLYYNVEVLLARRALKGPIGEVAEKSGMSWNCFEWELTV